MNIKQIALALAMLIGGAVAVQAANQDFRLVNNTGLSFTHLYLAPSRTKNWSGDILGMSKVGNGSSTMIRFKAGSRYCVYDVMVRDAAQRPFIVPNINLCKIHALTFRSRKGQVFISTN